MAAADAGVDGVGDGEAVQRGAHDGREVALHSTNCNQPTTQVTAELIGRVAHP